MDRHERWTRILEILAAEGRVAVDDVARRLGASAATVRRDLAALEERRSITRVHGGAVAQTASLELDVRHRRATIDHHRQRIGRAAAAEVPPGATVVMNGGTTVTAVARALVELVNQQPSGDTPAVRVVTNALNVAVELNGRPAIRLLVTGGLARPDTYELSGPIAADVLAGHRFDLAILGVDALHPEDGAMTRHEEDAHLSRLMARNADRVVIVADHAKLGRRAFATISPARDIDLIITDAETPPDLVAALQAAGPQVITV